METHTLQHRLDRIEKQLHIIVEEMAAQRRRRQEREELTSDLNRIARDVFQAAVEELNGVAQHIETGDVLFLLKKLLRNVRHLSRLMDQLESLMHFFEDAGPLTKDMALELMEQLDALDHKGYFEFFTEALKIIDTIVTSFTVEDVRLLRENIAHILLTVKNFTQPEMLATLNNALSFFKEMDIEIEEHVSYWKIFQALRDPEMRRGLAFMIQFLKNMASKNGEWLKPLQPTQETKQED